jgi:hypothetical protein
MACKESLLVVRDTLGQLGWVVRWGEVLNLRTEDSIEQLGNDNCLVALLPSWSIGTQSLVARAWCVMYHDLILRGVWPSWQVHCTASCKNGWACQWFQCILCGLPNGYYRLSQCVFGCRGQVWMYSSLPWCRKTTHMVWLRYGSRSQAAIDKPSRARGCT